MSNGKTKLLLNKENVLVGYKIISQKDGEFTIPVLDNRNPKHQQRIAKTFKKINSAKGSKYIKPSFSGWGFSYNVSRKK
jgi:hypothetical protein